MLRPASLSMALFGFLAMLAVPAFAEAPAVATPSAAPAPTAPEPHAAAPAVTAPEAPKVEAPKAEAPAVEAPKAEPVKTESAKPTEKSVGKMRDRWKKMTPEQKEEMKKKAEGRLGERYDRLKTAEQETIKNIMAEISKLNKEQRSILMAKIRQQASKDRAARKAMKAMENSKGENSKKEAAPAADPNVVKH